MKTHTRLVSTLVVLGLAAGCSPQSTEPSRPGDAAKRSEPLYFLATPWPNKTALMCWTAASTARPEYAAFSARLRATIAGGWTQAAGISFIDTGVCGASPTGTIVVSLDDTNPSCNLGYSASAPTYLHLNPTSKAATIHHEVGHCLGFHHESQRPDSTVPGCDGPDIVGGDTLGTPVDNQSALAHSYCSFDDIDLSYWDGVGAQRLYGMANAFADVSGDGKADAMLFEGTGARFLTSTGSVFSWGLPASGSVVGHKGTFFADVNGDGKADAVAVGSDAIWARLSTGTDFAASPTKLTQTPFYGHRWTFFADVSGDGRADAVAAGLSDVRVRLATGGQFKPPAIWSDRALEAPRGVALIDVNGDHRADLVEVEDDAIRVRLSSGTKFDAGRMKWSDAFVGERGTFFADVTGDGQADAIAIRDDGIWVKASLGKSFAATATNYTAGPFGGTRGTYFADVTGDGRADAIAVNQGGLVVRPSTGSAFPVSGEATWIVGTLFDKRASTCFNGALDSGETAIDCGGLCAPCAAGRACATTADCAEGACVASVCVANPSCANGFTDPGESKVDCGGACGPCYHATCVDGFRNAQETDIDCGGNCGPCAAGQMCGAATDCASRFCTGGLCVDSCHDGVKNGPERGIDCGDVCGACTSGQLPGTCSNGAIGGTETDLDCGGTVCNPCALGAGCTVDEDCQSGVCSAGICAPPRSCVNDLVDGTETDLDCGGSTGCARCAIKARCVTTSDCASGGTCAAGRCAIATCFDGVKTASSESDVDCGGAFAGGCPRCGVGQTCNTQGANCVSGVCGPVSGVFVCLAPTCSDAVRNGAETGVNCGGASGCGACAPGQTCVVTSDCQSPATCVQGVCTSPPSCSDGAHNGGESDVDCGGSAPCQRCNDLRRCALGSDCKSGVCGIMFIDGETRFGCKVPTCTDGVGNGLESDVDCGGAGPCPRCGSGRTCGVHADCGSGTCSGDYCI